MGQISIRRSLFRILLGSVVLTAGLILLSVWNVADGVVQRSVKKDLAIDAKILQQIVEERAKGLYASTKALSTAYEFKAAFASKDAPTISSVLETMNARQGFDFLIMLSLDTEMIAGYPAAIGKAEVAEFTSQYRQINSHHITRGYVFMHNTLFHAVVAPIKAPRVIGYLGTGFTLNDDFLSELSEVVDADVIVSGKNDLAGEVINSSLPRALSTALINEQQESVSWLKVMGGADDLYILRELSIEGLEHLPVTINLALDVSEQYSGFLDLHTRVIVISLLIIVFALVISMKLAKQVSTPINNLVEAADEMSRGNYEKVINPGGRVTEVGELANAFISMQSDIRSREERIRYQAQHDMLTGLYNRFHIDERLNARLAAGEPLQILGINIAGVRTISDTYGYANGDFCITVLAQRLRRWPGMAARLSSDNLLFIPEQPMSDLQIETFRYILEQPVEADGFNIPMKVLFALLNCPEDGDSAQEIFRKINIINDEVSQTNDWLIRFEHEMETKYLRRLNIISELKRALISANSELSMVYQPKINLVTEEVCSLEALLRWNSATLGSVAPDEFIGIAEQAGLIDKVTNWVIERTLVDLAGFRTQGYAFTVALNLSTQDIQRAELIDILGRVMTRENLQPDDIELEITESDLVKDAAAAMDNLTALRNLGYRFAIDDFGTGYSSLAYLKNLPVDTIKIDKSFVLKLSTDSGDQQIVHTVLSLAKAFELSVVAEGVEDEASLNILRAWGCNVAQGYFISRPLTIDALCDWLSETRYVVKKTEKI